ncbi:hypothetical protein EDB19DRAFT_1704248 [Suillus lakei]|nr:hypothetical protein EDB19DRAFT_1704248 [Suillus lakei]
MMNNVNWLTTLLMLTQALFHPDIRGDRSTQGTQWSHTASDFAELEQVDRGIVPQAAVDEVDVGDHDASLIL